MPSHKSIKVLITGFGPFPGQHSNPSEKLLRWLEVQNIQLGQRVQLRTELIPTRWTAVEKFASGCLAEFDPDIALHFGVHSRNSGLCVEKLARNCTCTHADASGEPAPRQCVKVNAPQTLKSTIEPQKLVTKLQTRGLPAQSSTNAGRYLCNALLFASLYQGRKRALQRQTGFIHIPRLNAHGITKDALLKAVKITLKHCVSQHIHKTRMREETGG